MPGFLEMFATMKSKTSCWADWLSCGFMTSAFSLAGQTLTQTPQPMQSSGETAIVNL